jgi:protein-disulfide isomerase
MTQSPRAERRRSQRQKKRDQPRLSNQARILIAIGIVLAVGAGVVLLLSSRPSSPAAGSQSGQSPDPLVLMRDDSPRLGPENAPVTVVEFLDFECEACGAMYPVVERVRREYGDRMSLVVRYLSLHRNSTLAARAAEAAGRQGKYEAMYSMLFQNQQAWGGKPEPPTELFLEYARSLGLDMEQFPRDMQDPALEAKVNRDRADATAAGVRGTPTFFVNGTLVGSVMTYAQLKAAIDAALR